MNNTEIILYTLLGLAAAFILFKAANFAYDKFLDFSLWFNDNVMVIVDKIWYPIKVSVIWVVTFRERRRKDKEFTERLRNMSNEEKLEMMKVCKRILNK